MIRNAIIALLFFLICQFNGLAQVATYNWPTDAGQALLSNKYKVYVKHGDNPEIELQVLMSNAIYKGDYRADYLKDRTFSFAQLTYDDTAGEGLTFRVVKSFGNAASSVAIAPKSYGISNSLSTDGFETTFKVDKSTRYISINFKASDNSLTVDQNIWIKHMLCVFVNPPETEIPLESDSGTVVYSPNKPAADLEAAGTIIFKPGYYNLKDYQNPGTFISAKGKITLKKNQKMYMAGGAFIEGNIETSGDNVKIFGRGILSLRQYIWPSSPDYDGYDAGYIIHLNNKSTVQGIMVMEPCWHGIVGGSDNLIENIKFLGWHCNNDGIRVSSGSEIRNSFMRCVDDDFYDFGIYVHDMVLWRGHNGSIMTYGWGSYNSGASLMENIDVINPEWTGLGNNNGLIMSQTQLDYKPFDYGTGSTITTLKNIRIEGRIPGLTNIKTREGEVTPKVPTAKVGYLGDLIMENISVESQFEKSIIRGKKDVASDGTVDYFTKNITIEELTIGGVCVTEENKSKFFIIDTATTRDLFFKGCNTTGININFVSPVDGDEIIVGDSLNVSLNATDSDGTITSVKLYLNEELIAEKVTAPFIWKGYEKLVDMQIGEYTLKAVATDNLSNTWEEEIKVTVIALPNIESLQILAKSTSSILIQWVDVIDREKGFIIERAKAESTDFIKIDTLAANENSFLDQNLESFTMYHYRIRTLYESSATQPSAAFPGRTIITQHATLADNWQNASFGDTLVAMASTGTENNGVFTIDAGDGDFWTEHDRGHFIYKEYKGDCEIIAYMNEYYAHPLQWSMAGLMMRDTIAAGSKFAAMMLIAQPGGVLRDRVEYEGSVNQSPYPNGAEKAPYWVRLTRVGNLFTGSVSPDKINWTKIREVTIAMRETIYVGMCATTHSTESNGIYTFENVTLKAPAKQYSIVASANIGGTISPKGTNIYLEGSEITYTITPSANFAIEDVKIDGVSQGKIMSYTFKNLSVNHTINATFKQTSVTITAKAGSNGTISPLGNVDVTVGSNKSFYFTANEGYKVKDVLVDGYSKGSITSYTFQSVTENHTIVVSFIEKSSSSNSIQENNENIYPNPVVQTLTIENISDAAILQIVNLEGKKVFEQSINSSKEILDLSNLRSGIYTLNIVYRNNTSKTYKITKK